MWFNAHRVESENGMVQDAETLSEQVANHCGRESDGGRKPPQCCEAARRCRFSRDQMGSEIFGDGIGRSEPDGRVYCKPKLEGHRAWVLEQIKASPSITLAGLWDRLGD